MKKIAIVTSEGGMSCAYSAGVILALVEKFNLVNPHVVVGSSGSTGTLAYYVAGQYESIKNIWENFMTSKRFISFTRFNKIVDMDYLVDDILKKCDVLDIEKIKSSKIKLFISATNIETGKPDYFSNQAEAGVFEALRASGATPVFYNRPVKIKDRTYIDGAIGAPLAINVEKAKQEGAEVIFVIDNSNHSFVSNVVLRVYSLFTGKALREQIQRYRREKKYESDDKQVLVISPSIQLPIHTLDNNRDHVIRTIQIGYDDVVRKSDQIKELLFI
ncbi:MAG: hypothetical protein EXS47_02625 [Candidatus Zambryskibacteria bacterium]|nr:hypothetical protein [Candidatus Zambryskibacteria bacterium]